MALTTFRSSRIRTYPKIISSASTWGRYTITQLLLPWKGWFYRDRYKVTGLERMRSTDYTVVLQRLEDILNAVPNLLGEYPFGVWTRPALGLLLSI